MVITLGRRENRGTAYWKWPRSAPSRRSKRGTATAMRTSCILACRPTGSIPSGTSSG
jgi:hypothetical protein